MKGEKLKLWRLPLRPDQVRFMDDTLPPPSHMIPCQLQGTLVALVLVAELLRGKTHELIRGCSTARLRLHFKRASASSLLGWELAEEARVRRRRRGRKER